MAEYQRYPQRFEKVGQTTRPRDLAPPGRQQLVENLRPYTPGTLEVRAGLRQLGTGSASNPIHTLARLNDVTTNSAIRVVGAGGNLYAQAVADPQPLGSPVDSGWIGAPLSTLAAQPTQSPQPFLYLADRQRQRKLDPTGAVYAIGLAPPTGPPSVVVSRPLWNLITALEGGSSYNAAGAVASSPSTATRVSTTVASVLYDSGSTGSCAIVPTDPTNIVEGMLLTIGSEVVLVEQILLAIASTTIAQIIYDNGTGPGPCQIQPALSLGLGQVDDVPLAAYRLRNPQQGNFGQGVAVPRGQVDVPPQTDLTQTSRKTRTVDFPVNALVTINGTETVRILSITVGSDGIQSFRCITAGTFTAGMTLTGSGPGFRCATTTTIAATNTISAHHVHQTLTQPTGSALATAYTGGIQTTSGFSVDLSHFSTRPVMGDDILRFQIRVSDLTKVTAVRLYLDVDRASNDYLRNYFLFEWRASDLITAIQATNTASVDLLPDAAAAAFAQRELLGPAYAYDPQAIAAVIAALEGKTSPNQATSRSPVPATDPTSRALALGNSQWITLTCRVNQLIRVGTDTSRTLAHVKGAEILVTAKAASTATVLQVDYSGGLYLTGGYGPDIGQVGDPYVYRYRYRISSTGEVSNPSPASRGGALARRQAVTLTGSASPDGHVDRYDWFRLGGGLSRWTYIGTSTGVSLTDVESDQAVDGGDTLPFDDFQPWPIADSSQNGTCTAAGGAIKRTTGANFDLRWAPGTLVQVNGFTAPIDQVISTDVLLLSINVGSGTNLPYTIQEPEIQGQPLPVWWASDGFGTFFATGYATNPGTVYWSKPLNPDVTSDRNSLIVSDPDDPLQNGWLWDHRVFVASTSRIWELTEVAPGVWVAATTAASKRGLWTRWSFCVASEGVYFLARDGIYRTEGGTAAVSITDEDLKDLFPHDGLPGRGTPGKIEAPDMTQETRLRLTWVDGLLYFDYRSTAGHDRTLIYNPREGTWIQDNYGSTGAMTRLGEPGAGVHNQVVARGADLAIYDGHQDFGAGIPWKWESADIDGGDSRLVKQWGDAILDMDPKGDTITITPVFNHADISLTPQTRAGSGRFPFVLDLADGGGQLARSIGLYVTGTTSTNPVLFLWEPSALLKAPQTTRRATDWDDLGVSGAKFIQGILIRANTYSAVKTFLVQGDGATKLTLSIIHNGELTIAYPIASTGWTPFVASLVRLWPSGDDDPYLLLDARWVWEPAPELATEWTTQPTTHDFPGYLHVRDGFFAYSDAASAITFEVIYDGVSVSTTITPASTAYARAYVILPARKGRSVSYRWRSNTSFRLYRKDTSVRVHAWGSPHGYTVVSPFGGESRLVGAQI